MVKSSYLALSWSTSRGQDTYGYNIARLDDNASGQRFKCMGGGYDMVGTCVGQYLMSAYMGRLIAAGPAVLDLYGARLNQGSQVYLDGACGLDCMIRIAAAIGVRITSNYNRRANRGRGATDGYFVSDYGSADALRAAKEEC